MAMTMLNKAIDVDNYNNIQGRPTFPNKSNSESSLISSIVSLIPYHQKMEINNDLLDEDIVELVDSSQLLYDDNNGVSNPIGEVVDNRIGKNKQHISNKASALKNMSKFEDKGTNSNMDNKDQTDNIINIQILYDSNKSVKLDL